MRKLVRESKVNHPKDDPYKNIWLDLCEGTQIYGIMDISDTFCMYFCVFPLFRNLEKG